MTSLYKVVMGKVLFVTGKSVLLYFEFFCAADGILVMSISRILLYSMLHPLFSLNL